MEDLGIPDAPIPHNMRPERKLVSQIISLLQQDNAFQASATNATIAITHPMVRQALQEQGYSITRQLTLKLVTECLLTCINSIPDKHAANHSADNLGLYFVQRNLIALPNDSAYSAFTAIEKCNLHQRLNASFHELATVYAQVKTDLNKIMAIASDAQYAQIAQASLTTAFSALQIVKDQATFLEAAADTSIALTKKHIFNEAAVKKIDPNKKTAVIIYHGQKHRPAATHFIDLLKKRHQVLSTTRSRQRQHDYDLFKVVHHTKDEIPAWSAPNHGGNT